MRYGQICQPSENILSTNLIHIVLKQLIMQTLYFFTSVLRLWVSHIREASFPVDVLQKAVEIDHIIGIPH